MAKHVTIDLETYSSVDLGECGAYKYAESPDFQIILVGYMVDSCGVVKQWDALTKQLKTYTKQDDGTYAVTDTEPCAYLPEELEELLDDDGVEKRAHNAAFERICFNACGYSIPPTQWRCTMVKAAYCGLPLALGQLSKVLDLENKKQETGKMLIRYFSTPCKPTKVNGGRTRNYPHHAPEKWEQYCEYNVYDVLSEDEIDRKLEKYVFPDSEQELYALDQRINDRGILIDIELAKSAVRLEAANTEEVEAFCKQLSGIDNPNSRKQVIDWITLKTGVEVESLGKDVIDELIAKFANYPDIVAFLNARKQLSKTSVKKYQKMLSCACNDNRGRGFFQFYGANRTGRWAGRLLQLQNLSKNHEEDLDNMREMAKQGDKEGLELLYSDIPDVLSQLVRPTLIAPSGKIFSVADFSAIEARVISWLSNETWRLDVFKGDGKIYEATGSRMFGIPISAITKGSPERAKSKICELALGFQGGVGALERMAGTYHEDFGVKDPVARERVERDLVKRWREANPKIVEMWSWIQETAVEVVRRRSSSFCTFRNLLFECDGNYLTIGLPSGRKLFYCKPSVVREVRKGLGTSEIITYWGMNQETKTWGQVNAYGGKFTENIVQAIARDLLALSMKRLDENGFDIAMHVHDEAICEVPFDNSEAYYKKMVELMQVSPKWAEDLPLRADGYISTYYKKD